MSVADTAGSKEAKKQNKKRALAQFFRKKKQRT
jgi:hypothetical protein